MAFETKSLVNIKVKQRHGTFPSVPCHPFVPLVFNLQFTYVAFFFFFLSTYQMQESMPSPSDTDTSKSDTPSVFMELCEFSVDHTRVTRIRSNEGNAHKILHHTLG